MGDAVGHLQGQRKRVCAADQQMAGVQAQLDARDPSSTRSTSPRVSTMVPDMRVQHGEHPALGGGVGEPVEIGSAAWPIACSSRVGP